jgi:probable O-glycosylation ligase (exosortase A-associated)
MVSMALFLVLKSRRPVQMSVTLMILIGVGIAFMPDSWTDRMSTIGEYDADTSAMSRLYTWKTVWNLAIDRPLVGGGFRSDSLAVFLQYAPDGSDFDSFRGSVWVAHSIYFQTLGEHGFVGLGLFMLLGVVTWRRAGQLARLTRGDPEFGQWVPRLMPMSR